MKVLIMSYFFEPEKKVGAKRTSYWAKNLHKYGVECDVITTTDTEGMFDNSNINVFEIPITAKKPFLNKFIKDEGVLWKSELINFFKNKLKTFDYDAVIISGDPFMHFSVSKFLKNNFMTKIILDFRDPFANNPSFKSSWLKNKIKSYYEKKFLKYADLAITVNKFCYDLLSYSKTRKIIIENGYDEHVIGPIIDNFFNGIEAGTIAHAGTFTEYRSPEVFLNAICDENINFSQYGAYNAILDRYASNNNIKYKGFVDYETLIKELIKTEIGLIITEGKAYESTTKIFDYMALNKKILIITNGEKYTGNIHEISKYYDNLEWSLNEEGSIVEAITRLKNKQLIKFDASKFSRKNGIEILVNELNKIK